MLRIMVDESVTYSVDAVDIVLKFGLFLGAIFQIVAILSILVLPRRTSDKVNYYMSCFYTCFYSKYVSNTHRSITHGTKGAETHT